MNAYQALAVGVLALHLGWIVWVVFGWVVTRNRPVLPWLHILSPVDGILTENLAWSWPQTVAETRLEARAGIQPYHEPLLVHHLEALVYPDVPATALRWAASAVCASILGVYGLRLRR